MTTQSKIIENLQKTITYNEKTSLKILSNLIDKAKNEYHYLNNENKESNSNIHEKELNLLTHILNHMHDTYDDLLNLYNQD